MKYRLATTADIPQLSVLRWDFKQEKKEKEPVLLKKDFLSVCTVFLKTEFRKENWAFWVAEEEKTEKIVAHIFLQKIKEVPQPHKPENQYGYITNTYVCPAFRNKGIGSKLLKKVIAWAKAEDLEILIVWPNEMSRGFYERAGFSGTSELMEMILRD